MPGKINQAGTDHNFFTAFRLVRQAVAAANPDPTVDAAVVEVDIEYSDIGFGNVIILGLDRKTGTGAINVALYRKFVTPNTACSISGWKKMQPDSLGPYGDASNSYIEVVYTGLMPGTYRAVVTSIVGGETWDIHECHNSTRATHQANGW